MTRDLAPSGAPPRGLMDISRLRFLVVEDQAFQRWMVENTLRGLGAQSILTAVDGNSAIDVLRDESSFVDIVVTDLDMPGMDGLEFIRRLGDCGWNVSLIVLSSMERRLIASVEPMAAAYGVRLLAAVEKPANAAALREAIARHGASPRPAAQAGPPVTLAEAQRALAAEHFEVFYQPKVQLTTGQVAGAEALVRWPRDDRIIPAQQFIALIEAGNLMPQLSELVFKRAMAACREWLGAGIGASVAVNLSLRSASDTSLADWLMQLVQFHGIEPRHVVLEVTETSEAPHLGKALENLSRLRMRGFGLSIDDYGMGYSSMQQLMRIPFTELKIDRDFVRNAAKRDSERAMLESSLELADKLGITAVAEGVETRAEWDLVKTLGCDLAQGYFIAAAMAKDDFIDWARRGWAVPQA